MDARNHEDVAADDTRITDVCQTYLMWLTLGSAIRPGATTFAGAFDPDNRESAFYEAVLQMFFKAAAQMRMDYDAAVTEGRAGGDAGGLHGDPIVMSLETVVSDEPDPTLAQAAADGLVDVDEDDDAAAQRPFMRNVPKTHTVVEYRIWMHVRSAVPELDMSRL